MQIRKPNLLKTIMQTITYYLLLVAYLGISIPLFNKVYDTSKVIIDEEFHIRQAKYFCMDKFGVVSELNFVINYSLNRTLSVGSQDNYFSRTIFDILRCSTIPLLHDILLSNAFSFSFNRECCFNPGNKK